jgi:ABC-type glutathione transport system ATPase component
MSVPLLSIHDLHCSYHGSRGIVRAVQGVSLDVGAGETLALVGESGCGKTTLARCILGLQKPDSGQILLNGRDLVPLSRHGRRSVSGQVQCVFQDPFSSLNPRKRVAALIREPMDVQKMGSPDEREARVRDLMEQVGLRPEWARRFPHEFSGGQRQRIGIARALALNPSLIVCDEPVSALDVSVQAQIINLLYELQRDLKLSYLFITHDLTLVENFADRVALMYLGQIVETGPAQQVWRDPQHEFTKRLIDAIPIPDPGIRLGQGRSAFRQPA